jgi:PAS domain S-box-containing protein
MTDPQPTGPRDAQLFRLLAEAAADHAAFGADAEGLVRDWNAGAERLFGYPASEIVGRPASLLFTPDDAAAPLDDLSESLRAGRACAERWMVRKGGSRFWAATAVSPLWDGKLLRGLAVVVRDRTEARRAEDAARAADDRFRALMAQAPFSVQVLDASGRTLSVNRAWQELWGLTVDQIRDYDLLADPQLEAKGIAPYLRRAFAGEPVRVPAIQYDPEQTLPGRTRHAEPGRWVGAVAYPVKDAAGRVREVILVHEDVTDRKRAEDSWRESEQRFASFMEHLPGLAWVKDAAGRYAYANDAALRAFATPREELYGRTDDDFFPPDTAAQFRENDRRALEGSAVQTFEALQHPDGAWHHSLVTKFSLPAPDGRPAFVGGIAIDVTELRRAEESRQLLSEAGAVLASTLDYEATLASVARLAVPRLADWCSVYLTDAGAGLRRIAVAHADPEKVRWAEEMARRYPPDPGDPRGVGGVIRSGEPVLVPDVPEEMLASVARDPEHLALLRDLGLRSVMIVPLVARGRTLGAVTFVAAESGRRYGPDDLALAQELGRRAAMAVDNARLFQQSEESTARLRLLVEASGRLTRSLELPAVQSEILVLSNRLVAADAYAMWRHDEATGDWAIVDSANLSDAYLRDWGRIPAPAAPMPDHPIVAEDVQAEAALESRRRMYQSEGIRSVVAVPLRVHGRVAGTLVFYYHARRKFDDVTVRVASALADLAGAALGTSELYRRESELRRRAEEADHAKDSFLAALGHELRNPLTVVVSSLHVLRELGERGLDRVPVMERQADVLRRLVDDLLDMARVTQGRIELRREPVRLADAVAQAVETARPLIDARGHALAVELPREELWLEADAVRLTQCVSNLLHNAAKYTDPGGRIALAGGCDGGAAVLRVRDSGIGIPPGDLDRIFELFSQVQDARSHSQGGLGIGLSLVRKLVGMMGGSVTAHSGGSGTGSEFVIRLPLAAPPAPPAPAPAPPAATPADGRAEALRVVIADDNADAADTLAMLVEMWGHAVRVAYDGPGAVEAAREFRPDVCLFDISMPGFDGYEAARRVRAGGELPGVVLAAMSGFGQDSDRARGADAGFDHFLVKPVAPSAVEQLLRELGRASR